MNLHRFGIIITVISLFNFFLTGCEKKQGNEMKTISTSDLSQLMHDLRVYIDTLEGTVAVSFQTADQDQYMGINDTLSMHAASTMKVPVMMEVFRQVQAGKFSLSDSIVIKNEFKSIIDGSLYSMDITEDGGDRLYAMIGKKESIRSLVHEMITYSGNLATNLLIGWVQPENVQNLMKQIGANDIQVLRGVEDIKAFEAGKSNTTTAKDLAIIYQDIYNGTEWTESSRKEMIDILLDQKFNKKIPAGLPKEVKVAHKTGSITEIDHDSGIIYPPQTAPYILVVLTKGFKEHERAQETIAEISRRIYAWYMGL